jgi:hypothetical protein
MDPIIMACQREQLLTCSLHPTPWLSHRRHALQSAAHLDYKPLNRQK